VARLQTIHHFGPDVAHFGGMASVIQTYLAHGIGGDRLEFHPTWRPGPQLTNARLTAAATAALVGAARSDIVHVHLSKRGSFVREGWIAMLARARGLTTVGTIHSSGFLAFAESHPRLVAIVLERFDAVTCLTDDVRSSVEALAPGIPVRIVANPVEPMDDLPPVEQTEEIVLFAGAVSIAKGADVLWQAWPLVADARPQAKCVVVGPRKDVDLPAPERMDVRPAVDRSSMRELLGQSRIVTLPSRGEAMPMILLEAMSAGRPFVATPVGSVPQLAHAAGRLVPAGDHEALAAALGQLLGDPEECARLGASGRVDCLATHGISVVDAKMREVYAAAAA
jgi:glycosyltransferase involved in cell wall biosynthesis